MSSEFSLIKTRKWFEIVDKDGVIYDVFSDKELAEKRVIELNEFKIKEKNRTTGG